MQLRTVLLLIISNTFMTVAWYGHLKYKKAPLIGAIVVSWAIAFFEYVFQVPANRIGSNYFSLSVSRASAVEQFGVVCAADRSRRVRVLAALMAFARFVR
jgi:uncharacterized protein (DUF486 family)